LFALGVLPLGDGRVQLTFTPELHFGNERLRPVYGQGTVRIEPGRTRDVFDQLAIETVLAPGQILVLTRLPGRSRSLGHYFFTEEQAGSQRQKLLLVRISQTQYDDRFDDDLLPAAAK
jgi:hypothetical protein